MSDTAFFVIKWAALTVAFCASVLPTFFKVRDDASNRFTRIGRAGFALAIAAFGLSAFTDQHQRKREAREQARADSVAQEKADARTQREERLLHAESDSLRALQRKALLQMDSARAASQVLMRLQHSAIEDLGASLLLSRSISDSLQYSVAITRSLADSMRVAETRAAERNVRTLASLARVSNPLTTMSASFGISFPRSDSLSARLLDALDARVRIEGQVRPTYPQDAQLVVGGKRFEHVLPTYVYFYFWRGDDCEHSFNFNTVMVSGYRQLNYDSAAVDFDRSRGSTTLERLSFRWNEGPFEIRTLQNLTVDDMAGACLKVELGPGYMTWPELSSSWWANADVYVSTIGLPQGRFAWIHPKGPSTGRSTHYMKLWETPPSALPTQMEMTGKGP